jgi:aminoglycoside phosphotransferase (APT) family kinase protein
VVVEYDFRSRHVNTLDTSAEHTINTLTALVRAKTGDGGARVHSLEPLLGHAGFSYSFWVDRTDGGSAAKLVVRMAPPEVKIAGPADIARQAKIMTALADTAVAVPPVYWYGDEAAFFGRSYMVVGFVEGFKLTESPLPRPHLQRLARRGIEMMAALHSLAWESRRWAFGDPFSLNEEMQRLDHLLDRPTLDAAFAGHAPELRERLRATLPQPTHIGCVHGDFQWTNMLFNDDRPVALIDWEIALIGPTLLDVGWLCFFSDPANFRDGVSFFGGQKQQVPILSAEEVIKTYAAAVAYPVEIDEISWFRAFSGYRFGVITCFNVMLHRRGKRHDPHWEVLAPSAPLMFEHALELLG